MAALWVSCAAACGSSAPAARAPAETTATAAPPAPPASCDSLGAAFDRIGASVADEVPDPDERKRVQYYLAATRTILVEECQVGWLPDPSIACFTNASDEEAWTRCEQALPQETRDAVQHQIDAIPPPPANTDAERVELAREQVRRISFEYFPQWAAMPSNGVCPGALTDLTPYARPYDTTWQDPWGNLLSFSCTDGLLTAISAGPDGTIGTPDDVGPRL